MSAKKADDKTVVSFSSDSDDDDSSSSSSSSRLSSSESSGEESEVEAFKVPLPPSSQASSQGAGGRRAEGGKPAAVEESSVRFEAKNKETVKAVSPEPRKSPGMEAKDKPSPRKTENYEEVADKKEPIKTKDKLASDSMKELDKSPGKQQDTADELKTTKKGANLVAGERAKSPRITVNDVEEEAPKQTKKSPEGDIIVTTNKTTTKSPEDTMTSKKASNNRARSPKNVEEAEKEPTSLSTKSTKEGRRAVSSRKEEAEEDLGEDAVTTKISSKLTAERAKSPKDTSEELASVAETKSINQAKSPKKTTEDKDINRAKSPKKSSEDKDVERAKSPKMTFEEKDPEWGKSPKRSSEAKDAERTKLPKKKPEEKDIERAKSPKKTLEAIDVESPKTSSLEAGEVKKKSIKDSSKAPYELLRSVESPEKSPTRTVKTRNFSEDESSTVISSGKSSQKDLEGKKPNTSEAADQIKSIKVSKKSAKNILSDGNEVEKLNTTDKPEKITEFLDRPRENRNTKAEDFEKDMSTVEPRNKDVKATPAGKNVTKDLSTEVPKSGVKEKSKDKMISGGEETQRIGVSGTKITDSSDSANEVEQLLKEIRQKRLNQMSIQPELEPETPESGNKSIRVTVDDLGKTDDASKTMSNPNTDSEVADKDYIKVTSSSRTPAADETDSKSGLENEESEFTYRRKSMDDFIKRILAEAREERLKQKQGGSSKEATEGDRKPGIDGYADRNGDLTECGLDRSKWNSGGSSGERDGSMLDRRLAIIEKRRFGDSSDAAKGGGAGGVEGGRSKVGKETDEDETTKPTTKSLKNAADYDVNLDEDLEEINRFLQSRKSAASRFDFDESGLNDDATTATTQMKRRLATGKEQQQQQQSEEEDQPSSGSRSQLKKHSMDLEFNDDDERFLGRFKRERDSALPEDSFMPRRRDDTGEVVRERTRNVRVLVDQQVEIVHAMRNTSKSLDELEKEIREVRQVCLDRQARIEALEGALDAEYRAFESDQVAASDRQQQKSTDGLSSREDFATASLGHLRRQDKFKSDSLDEENFPFRRRSGSVTSTTSYTSGYDGRGRPGDGSNDGVDFRPPSGLKQSRRTSENESDFSSSGVDRRRGGSMARDRNSDLFSFGPDDNTSALLNQRPARSRASIATSNPAVDYTGSISGDSFLAKIRAKYSFLAPSLDNQGYSSSIRGQGSSGISSSSYTNYSSSSISDSRYGKRYGSRDFFPPSSSAHSSLGTGVGGYSTGGRYSIRDTRSPGYGTGGFITSSSISAGISPSYGDSSRMRRAQSVSEISFDRPTASPTNIGSSGGEFHSRFLDKVRGKKAMGEDPGSASKDHEKPFKSRFLKTTSFDAGSSSSARSDRLTNGFEDESETAAGAPRRNSAEVSGNV